MHTRTEATLARLRKAHWFSRAGVIDTDAADVLRSWFHAIESCSSQEWQQLCLEAANQYRARLSEKSPIRFEKWNNIVLAVKPLAQSLVREKTKQVIEENDLPQIFCDTVDWDILHLCMEAEYADVYPPGFFASQGYWYAKGHFPCGWSGEFPNGQLIIY
jgi:hypothetical protein